MVLTRVFSELVRDLEAGDAAVLSVRGLQANCAAALTGRVACRLHLTVLRHEEEVEVKVVAVFLSVCLTSVFGPVSVALADEQEPAPEQRAVAESTEEVPVTNPGDDQEPTEVEKEHQDKKDVARPRSAFLFGGGLYKGLYFQAAVRPVSIVRLEVGGMATGSDSFFHAFARAGAELTFHSGALKRGNTYRLNATPMVGLTSLYYDVGDADEVRAAGWEAILGLETVLWSKSGKRAWFIQLSPGLFHLNDFFKVYECHGSLGQAAAAGAGELMSDAMFGAFKPAPTGTSADDTEDCPTETTERPFANRFTFGVSIGVAL